MAWPFFGKKHKPVKSYKRGFSAAAINRLTASMVTKSQAVDWDLRLSLEILRSRSRSLCVNNDYAKKFLQMVSAHVVGPSGFNLVCRAGDYDAKGAFVVDAIDSRAIEDAFYKWAKRGNCDVTGMHSFFDVCNMYIKAVARDGEVLIKKVRGTNAGPFGFQLQVLDVDRLDHLKNEELSNGNIIKMGVEINSYGKPVAYHIRSKHPGENPYGNYTASKIERVPAEDIYHHFIAERPEQNRGIPWMHSAILRLTHLNGYEEAAIIAARVGASKMGIITSPDGDGSPLATDTDDQGNLIDEVDPGKFSVLPQGYEFTPFNPDYPHAMFAEFVKSTLRGVASGLGVSYNTISNDLEGVNFSSIRTGVLEERDNWMVIQNWMIEKFLDDVYTEWLRMALLMGAIKTPRGFALPASKFDKFNRATWNGRRWQWVDPVKDIDANVTAINNGLKSRAQVIAEQGRDIDDVMQALAEEQKKITELGISVASPNPQPQAAQNGGGENV